MKDYQTCIEEVGRSLGWLPTTHPSTQIPLSFAEKAAQLYASECVEEAVKLAREDERKFNYSIGEHYDFKYTELLESMKNEAMNYWNEQRLN